MSYSGYSTDFGHNALENQLEHAGQYLSADRTFSGGYAYHGMAYEGYNGSKYYGVTTTSDEGAYYNHHAGYLYEPGSTITTAYTSYTNDGGYASATASGDFSYDANGSFYSVGYKSEVDTAPDGASTDYEQQTSLINDLHGGFTTYTSYQSTYTDAAGYASSYSGSFVTR